MPGASSRTPTSSHLATFADLLKIPEDKRFHEVLDGDLVQKAMPGGKHSLTHTCVLGALHGFHRRSNGKVAPGGWWFLTEATVELATHEVVQPDIAAWRRERMPTVPDAYPLKLRPDFVCEIMTDSDARRRDGLLKRRIYANAQVPHYWLVDTERERLTVLWLTEHGYVEVLDVGRGELVRAEPFDALELPVGVLFGDDL